MIYKPESGYLKTARDFSKFRQNYPQTQEKNANFYSYIAFTPLHPMTADTSDYKIEFTILDTEDDGNAGCWIKIGGETHGKIETQRLLPFLAVGPFEVIAVIRANNRQDVIKFLLLLISEKLRVLHVVMARSP